MISWVCNALPHRLAGGARSSADGARIRILPGPVPGHLDRLAATQKAPVYVALPRGHVLCELDAAPIAALDEEPLVCVLSEADARQIDDIVFRLCAGEGFTLAQASYRRKSP